MSSLLWRFSALLSNVAGLILCPFGIIVFGRKLLYANRIRLFKALNKYYLILPSEAGKDIAPRLQIRKWR